jgi:hypothetical protein
MITRSVIRNTEIGAFMLCDASFLESYGGKPKTVLHIPTGTYRMVMSVTSKGGFFDKPASMKKTSLIQITSGKLFVGDPSETFTGKDGFTKWNRLIDATKLLKVLPQSAKVIDTGGDGLGEITYRLTKKGEIVK